MHEQLAGYISGPVNAEDLAVAPGGEWVLTSGMTGPTAPLGRLYAVSVADGACNEIFPYRGTSALDARRFVQQPDLNPLKFRAARHRRQTAARRPHRVVRREPRWQRIG